MPSLAAKFCAFKRKRPQKSELPPNVASSSATTERNDHGEDLPRSPAKIVDSAWKSYTERMNNPIELVREKFKSGSGERDFEQLQKAIAKLKLQIPAAQVNIFDNDYNYVHAALPSSSKQMHADLLLLDSGFVDTKEYVEHMSLEINRAHMKFREIHESLCNPDQKEYDVTIPKKIDELQKAIKSLKVQIPSHVEIHSAASNRHPHQWPNINGTDDKMTHFFYKDVKDPEDANNCSSDGLWKAFSALPQILRICLLCFFKFPREAIIKRTVMIYMWIGLGYTNFLNGRDTNENYANKIFDYLVDNGFIQPIYQTCSLVPDSCRMCLVVRAALYKDAKYLGFTSNDNLQLNLGFDWGQSCMVNVGQANLDWEPEVSSNEARNDRKASSEPPNSMSPHHPLPSFPVSSIFAIIHSEENAHQIRNLYLGRWQRLTKHTHHIELTDTKVLDGLKNMKILTFLSLQGISMITELPTSMVKLKCLEILDLRACHNLEAIPENIGMLKSLTHLDISECYFLEHMPESLSQLSNLEVLKGFVLGDKENKQSCTLFHLSRLQKLRKLNIYVSVKNFDGLWDFDHLQNFKVLQKLTISWGGCSFQDEKKGPALCTKDKLELPQKLQKLDLRCFPEVSLGDWFKPTKIEGLKKLYIQGGQLRHIGQTQECQGEQWNVEILCLKYLHRLEIDWSELRKLFPKLIYLMYKAEDPSDKRGVWANLETGCPEFTKFQYKEGSRGTVWMSKKALHSDKQLQKLQKYLLNPVA